MITYRLFRVTCSDCIAYTLAENVSDAADNIANSDKKAEILDVAEVTTPRRYAVMGDTLGFVHEGVDCLCVISARTESQRVIPMESAQVRTATFADFLKAHAQIRQIEQAFLLYSPNESSLNFGDGYWTSSGWGCLEDALMFTQEETSTFRLAPSAGRDARFVSAPDCSVSDC